MTFAPFVFARASVALLAFARADSQSNRRDKVMWWGLLRWVWSHKSRMRTSSLRPLRLWSLSGSLEQQLRQQICHRTRNDVRSGSFCFRAEFWRDNSRDLMANRLDLSLQRSKMIHLARERFNRSGSQSSQKILWNERFRFSGRPLLWKSLSASTNKYPF